MRRGRTGSAGIVFDVMALVLLLAGTALLFLPVAESRISQASMNREIEKVEEELSLGTGRAEKSWTGAYEWLAAYNAKVAAGEVAISSDPFSSEGGNDALFLQGLEDGLIGYIEIPTMDCSLPLYLGSTEENMLKGATVAYGSSVPLGEAPSNCVIAAHRSMRNAAMLRDIEKLSVGDEVRVNTVWQRLTYTVVEILIIDPTDLGEVAVQEGRDLVSLLTCHPYGSSASRYLVRCERSESARTEECAGDEGDVADEGYSVVELEDYARIAGAVILLACMAGLVVRVFRRWRGRGGRARSR